MLSRSADDLALLSNCVLFPIDSPEELLLVESLDEMLTEANPASDVGVRETGSMGMSGVDVARATALNTASRACSIMDSSNTLVSKRTSTLVKPNVPSFAKVPGHYTKAKCWVNEPFAGTKQV